MQSSVTELDFQVRNALAETHLQGGEWREALEVCNETLMLGTNSDQIQIFELQCALYYLAI